MGRTSEDELRCDRQSEAISLSTELRLAVNTRFQSQPVTGVQRYASCVAERLGAMEGIDVVRLDAPANRLVSRADELLTLATRAEAKECDATLSMCNWSPVIRTHRSVVVIHDILDRIFPEYYSPAYRACRRGYLEALKRGGSRVITVSEWSAHALRRILHREVDVVPCGVELRTDSEVAQIRQDGEERWGRQGPFLLFVGAHDSRKNVQFCEALLPWLRTSGHRLVVTARSGSMPLAGERPRWLDDNRDIVSVVVDPSDEDLNELYAAARVLLHPSRAEGFGLPLLEAYSFGTPFISSPVGVAHDVALEAWQVQPWHATRWIESLDMLADGRSESMATDFRNLAAQFSWDATALRIGEICRDVGDRSARRRFPSLRGGGL